MRLNPKSSLAQNINVIKLLSEANRIQSKCMTEKIEKTNEEHLTELVSKLVDEVSSLSERVKILQAKIDLSKTILDSSCSPIANEGN